MAIAPIEFVTQRLAFFVWKEHHIGPFQDMCADPEVMRYFPSVQTPEQSNSSIQRWRSQFEGRGWSLWAVELRSTGEFIGFIGLAIPKVPMPFGPCVEIGWRLKKSSWGNGYATEGAKECLRVGFEQIGLDEIVSFTALQNSPSIAVMQRIGMSNTNADFDHPSLPVGHPLRVHCLYKISRSEWDELSSNPWAQSSHS